MPCPADSTPKNSKASRNRCGLRTHERQVRDANYCLRFDHKQHRLSRRCRGPQEPESKRRYERREEARNVGCCMALPKLR